MKHMADREKTPNAWLIVLAEEADASEFWVEAYGPHAGHAAIRDGDGLILARRSTRGLSVERFARAYRVRRTATMTCSVSRLGGSPEARKTSAVAVSGRWTPVARSWSAAPHMR